MLNLEVYKKDVAWPEEFAYFMIKHYQDNEVPVLVHMVCSETGPEAKSYGFVSHYAARPETRLFICCHQS